MRKRNIGDIDQCYANFSSNIPASVFCSFKFTVLFSLSLKKEKSKGIAQELLFRCNSRQIHSESTFSRKSELHIFRNRNILEYLNFDNYEVTSLFDHRMRVRQLEIRYSHSNFLRTIQIIALEIQTPPSKPNQISFASLSRRYGYIAVENGKFSRFIAYFIKKKKEKKEK